MFIDARRRLLPPPRLDDDGQQRRRSFNRRSRPHTLQLLAG